METFFLAIGLRMGRTAVTDANAELNQPDGELGSAVRVLQGTAPQKTVVSADPHWHAVMA